MMTINCAHTLLLRYKNVLFRLNLTFAQFSGIIIQKVNYRFWIFFFRNHQFINATQTEIV